MELGEGGESPGLGGAASHMAGNGDDVEAVVDAATTGDAYCNRHFEIVNLDNGAIDLSTCREIENDSIHWWRWPCATDVYAARRRGIGRSETIWKRSMPK